MRTTVDLPETLHRRLRRAALDRHVSMSRLVAELIEEGLSPSPPTLRIVEGAHGLLAFEVGHPITAEDVALMEDEEMDGW